jgi:two-component system sensor kinase FixL
MSTPLGDPIRLLAAIVDASEDAIIGVDLDGTVRLWGSCAGRMYGYSDDEITGRSVGGLIPPDRAGELAWMLDHIRAGERISMHETVHVAKDGRGLDISLTIRPFQTASGVPAGAVLVARDIGARLRQDLSLRTTEARWRAIIDSAVDAIIVIDSKGAIEVFNQAAEQMFGYTEDDVRGGSINMLMPSPYREAHNGYISDYLRTGTPKIIGIGRDVTGLRRNGTTFPVHLSVGEMRIGNDQHFAGILHDLSARVALEARLREQASLARIGEMARLDALGDLIKDLLLFARPPTPRLAPVDVTLLLNLTVGLLSKDPAFGRVRIDVNGTAPAMFGDAEFLKIVFQNLLINAVQAMHGQGAVRVSIASNGRSCQIRIADTGPGLAPEALEKLFRPFFTTKARGTGLGLATAKRLIEAHGGTIRVESPPEGGTEVTIELPHTAEGEAPRP